MAYTEVCAREASSFRVTRRLAGGETLAAEFLVTRLPGQARSQEHTLSISFGRTDDAAPAAERFRPLEKYPAILWLYPSEDFVHTEVVHRYFRNYAVEPLRAAAALADSFEKPNLLDAVGWVRRRLDESV